MSFAPVFVGCNLYAYMNGLIKKIRFYCNCGCLCARGFVREFIHLGTLEFRFVRLAQLRI